MSSASARVLSSWLRFIRQLTKSADLAGAAATRLSAMAAGREPAPAVSPRFAEDYL
jgi:hypothetical protein